MINSEAYPYHHDCPSESHLSKKSYAKARRSKSQIPKRHLELTSTSPSEFDTLRFAELIRTGKEQSLLFDNWSL